MRIVWQAEIFILISDKKVDKPGWRFFRQTRKRRAAYLDGTATDDDAVWRKKDPPDVDFFIRD